MTRILWVAFGAGLAGVISVLLIRARARSARLDVGTVSEQWVAEHRAGLDDGMYY
jgi:hypothetical protein